MVTRLGGPALLSAENVGINYGDNNVVRGVNLAMRNKSVYALIGPSGCGKSTLLRCFNRMNDFIEVFRLQGTIKFKGVDINGPDADPALVRKKIAWYSKSPTPSRLPSKRTSSGDRRSTASTATLTSSSRLLSKKLPSGTRSKTV